MHQGRWAALQRDQQLPHTAQLGGGGAAGLPSAAGLGRLPTAPVLTANSFLDAS